MRYEIFEGNIERLEKKLKTIENKCRKYGCEFHYERLGEVFRTERDENGNEIAVKFIEVEASGKAVYNGWEFIASLEYTSKGNIIKKLSDKLDVPARYYSCEPDCEHCKTNRPRKYSYVVRNVESGEFKQVGRACLKDFTFGFSAENVAQYEQWEHELEEAYEPYGGCGFYSKWYKTEEVLAYAAETIRCYGYEKSDSPYPTKARLGNYWKYLHGDCGRWDRQLREAIRKEIESRGFDPERPESVELAKAAAEWVKNWEDTSNYAHNLKVVLENEYVTSENFGFIVSVFPTYNKQLEIDAERKLAEERARKEAEGSEYVGNVGDRVTVEIADYRCVTSWTTQFGTTGIYKIVDNAGHVFTWKTRNYIDEKAKTIVGTVKGHNEYRGCKQTELTRCRVS